jgi:hypothetical protein
VHKKDKLLTKRIDRTITGQTKGNSVSYKVKAVTLDEIENFYFRYFEDAYAQWRKILDGYVAWYHENTVQ